jgi:hypothetical protein
MTIRGDLWFAFRQMRKNPGFTITVLVTVGLCIGANVAVLSIVDTVFLRTLPYPDPTNLIMVVTEVKGKSGSMTATGQSGAAWELIRDGAHFLESAAMSSNSGCVNMVAFGHVDCIQQQRVSAGFFHVLGVEPSVGREFLPEEDIPN